MKRVVAWLEHATPISFLKILLVGVAADISTTILISLHFGLISFYSGTSSVYEMDIFLQQLSHSFGVLTPLIVLPPLEIGFYLPCIVVSYYGLKAITRNGLARYFPQTKLLCLLLAVLPLLTALRNILNLLMPLMP